MAPNGVDPRAGEPRVDLIIDGVNVNDIPDVLLSVDYPNGTRVWTLTVNGDAYQLSQPFDLYTAMDISAAFLAVRFHLDVTWRPAGRSTYTVATWHRLEPGEAPQIDGVADLLARHEEQTR